MEKRNATCAVLMELSANYQALAFRKAISVGALSFDMFEQNGATVMSALEIGAALALLGLYRHQRHLTSFIIYRLSGRFTAWHLDQVRRGANVEDLFNTFIEGVETLDLTLDPAITSARENFALAYHLPRTLH